jgi:outer membrane protein OmpA-like peptidoglycan-associated protein
MNLSYKFVTIAFGITITIVSCQSSANDEEAAIADDTTRVIEKMPLDSVLDIVDKTKSKKKDIIETFNFDHGSFTIAAKDTSRLNKLVADLRSDSYFLKIFGYTDTIGKESDNDKLCEKRTMAIYDYLNTRIPINQKQVYADWLGESAEVYDLHFPPAHPQQNCVDVWIIH